MLKWGGPTHIDKEDIINDTLVVKLPVVSDSKDDKGHYFNIFYEFRFPLSQLRAIDEEVNIENMLKDDICHAISYTGTLVDTSIRNAPEQVTLFIDTFILYLSADEGHFNVSGPLFL